MAQRPAEVLQIAAGPGVTTVFASVHPPARPENLRRLSQARAVLRVPQPAPEPLTGQKGAVCGDPAIRGTALAAIPARLDGCGLEEGVRVRAVAGVALSSPVDIDCPTARALKRWVETGVEPAIGRRGGGVVALSVAASYSCRPRNNVRGARVSEHGRGRAIDISGYVLANGTAVSVLKGWGSQAHGRALSAMRRAACGPFNTVLGPGSDRYHRDHLHLDTARGRGPYCR